MISMRRILLVEDDKSLLDGLVYSLQKNGYEPVVARTVKEFGQLWGKTEYDLLLLDVTLPDGTGFEICEKVRKISTVPVIFLTASEGEMNVIRGLDLGGDDYITKPFRLGELLSRIQALLRRAQRFPTEEAGACGGIELDVLQMRAKRDGRTLELTAGEYRLLCFLMENSGRVLTRTQIVETLWDCNESFVDDNTLSVYVRRLRSKVEEEPSNPRHLLTVRGLGYQWKP